MTTKISLSSIPPRDPAEPHRQATPLELFFDLISVVAIAAITAGLHHAISEGHGVEKLPVYIFIFVAIWWAWMNFTWFASAFDNDGPIYRILVMTIMGGELVFAGSAAHMFETMDFGWGIVGWTIMRIAMALLWLRASWNDEYRTTCLRYAIGIVLAQGCWIAFYFLAEPGSSAFFVLGAAFFLVEFAVPVFAELAKRTPFHRHHVIERYGLLAIISLGEIMLAISIAFGTLYEENLNWSAVVTGVSALVIVFGLFWIYFCEKEHLPKHGLLTEILWGYGHVFVFASIAVLGASIAAEIDLVTDHSAVSQSVVSWWIGVPVAAFFIALWSIRDRHFDLGLRGFALPGLAVIVLLAAILGLPSWAFAVLLIGTVLWRVPLFGPAPLHS